MKRKMSIPTGEMRDGGRISQDMKYCFLIISMDSSIEMIDK